MDFPKSIHYRQELLELLKTQRAEADSKTLLVFFVALSEDCGNPKPTNSGVPAQPAAQRRIEAHCSAHERDHLGGHLEIVFDDGVQSLRIARRMDESSSVKELGAVRHPVAVAEALQAQTDQSAGI